MDKVTPEQLEELEIELSEYPEWKSQITVDLMIDTLADIPEELYGILMRIIRQKKYNIREEQGERYHEDRYEDLKYQALEPEEPE